MISSSLRSLLSGVPVALFLPSSFYLKRFEKNYNTYRKGEATKLYNLRSKQVMCLTFPYYFSVFLFFRFRKVVIDKKKRGWSRGAGCLHGAARLRAANSRAHPPAAAAVDRTCVHPKVVEYLGDAGTIRGD